MIRNYACFTNGLVGEVKCLVHFGIGGKKGFGLITDYTGKHWGWYHK